MFMYGAWSAIFYLFQIIFFLQESILLESCSILQNKQLEYRKFHTKLDFTDVGYIKSYY